MITDIEVQGASITIQKIAADLPVSKIPGVFVQLSECDESLKFNIETETEGFHDTDAKSGVIRGHFSAVLPFEVEHLVDGLKTKSLLKNIKTQEFIIAKDGLYLIYPAGLPKALMHCLNVVADTPFRAYEVDLRAFQERLSDVAAIRVQNLPKTGVRTASLSGGDLESYEKYDVINPDHKIKSVSGMYPVGDQTMKITVDQKAKIRFSTPRGYIMDFRAVEAVFDRLCESQGE